MTATAKRTSLLACCLCCVISTAGFLLQPRHSTSPKAKAASHHTNMMMQPPQSAAASTAAPPPLFPPTSQYHPANHGLTHRRRWLVVDYDGTCTEHDTTPLLPRLAALVERHTGKGGEAPDAHERDLHRRLSKFQALEEEYVRLYGEAAAALASADGEGERPSMHEALDALDGPSNRVTGMISESRVLEGLGRVGSSELEGMLQLCGVSDGGDAAKSEEESVGEHKNEAGAYDVQNASNKYAEGEESYDKVVVRLRQGCEGTLARILLDNQKGTGADPKESPTCSGWSLAVLSINWCPALIDASLVRPVLRRRRHILRIDSCDTEVPIWSNRVDGEGAVALHVPGALAKREKILELRRHIQSDDDGPSVIVYVGDSSTDLAALLEADVGIVIGNSSSLSSIAERWGVRIEHLRHRRQHGFGLDADKREEKLLWRVESWHEIDEMLIELDGHWS